MPSTPANTMTISIAGKGGILSVPSLIEVLKTTIDALHEVDLASSVDGPALDWTIVSASYNSPLTITIRGVLPDGKPARRRVVTKYLDDVERLENTDKEPRYLSVKALQQTQKLPDYLANGVSVILFSCPDRQPVAPTARLKARVDGVLKRGSRTVYSEIEGVLDVLNLHDPKPQHKQFIIYDLLDDSAIRCVFREEMIKQVKSLMQRRVLVEGEVRYDRDGRPSRIAVKRIRAASSNKRPVRFGPGEEIDITGGVESAEYVRRMRDAE